MAQNQFDEHSPSSSLFSPFMHMHRVALDEATRIGQANMRFAQEQAIDGIEALKEMSRSKSLGELFLYQQRTMQSLAQKYFAHLNRLSNGIADHITPVAEAAAATTDNVKASSDAVASGTKAVSDITARNIMKSSTAIAEAMKVPPNGVRPQ